MLWNPSETPPDLGLVIALSEEFRRMKASLGHLEPIENPEFGGDDYMLELPVEHGRPYSPQPQHHPNHTTHCPPHHD